MEPEAVCRLLPEVALCPHLLVATSVFLANIDALDFLCSCIIWFSLSSVFISHMCMHVYLCQACWGTCVWKLKDHLGNHFQ